MRLKLNLTLLIILTIASHSLLRAQVVKKIGNDSVVVMTIKQGIAINNLIDSLENQVYKKSDSLSFLNKRVDIVLDSIIRINQKHTIEKDTLIQSNKVKLDSLMDYKNRYYKNLAVYNQFEKDVKFEQKLHRFNSTLFTLLVIFLYSQIK
jgi:flagellar biosynthesis chaperone FliJ